MYRAETDWPREERAGMEAATDWHVLERKVRGNYGASDWAPIKDVSGLGQHQGGRPGADPNNLCASLLCEQIAMLEAWLAPGGDWEHKMADAQRRLEELKAERELKISSLAALKDALEQVEHKKAPPYWNHAFS
jgi:hypothetical protein